MVLRSEQQVGVPTIKQEDDDACKLEENVVQLATL